MKINDYVKVLEALCEDLIKDREVKKHREAVGTGSEEKINGDVVSRRHKLKSNTAKEIYDQGFYIAGFRKIQEGLVEVRVAELRELEERGNEI
ncbi:hypothetical protein OIU76_022970 [Salix suchowensis]|nr:hypothetical protein OIU76_022970 [Salix suchowensis]